MSRLSPTLKKTLQNLSWLSFDRIIRLVGGVVVNAWIIRYLGPEQNGILNYALAVVGMFTPLAVLGMDAIIIRDIAKDPTDRHEILGSAFGLRLIGAASALCFAAISISMIRPDDDLIKMLVVISSLGLVFQSFDVIDYWFQSQIQSKYTVFAKNISFFAVGIAKIIAILAESSILVFVVMTSIELVISAFALVYMYKKNKENIFKWRFEFKRANLLLLNSWPIIISDLAVFIQMRVDQVMIGELLTNAEVGLYAAAQKVSEPLNFLPMIIMSSTYPVIVRTKQWSEEEYYRRLTNLYRLMFVITIIVCVPITIFSESIVRVLFGEQYFESATILSLLIWAKIYSNFGTARSIFISTENMFRHALLSSVCAVVVNITANYYLIQKYGVYGSIMSTHISFIVNIFVLDAISKKTRKNFVSMMTGMFTFYKFSITTNHTKEKN